MCLCFICVDSNLGTIITGYGCDYDKSNNIVDELKGKQDSRQRGTNKNGKLSAEVDERLSMIDQKMSLILEHLDKSKVDSVVMEDR